MTRPVAIYIDVVDTDPSPGITLLERAGFEVRVADSDSSEGVVEIGRDAQALLIGYSPVDLALVSRLPELRIVATQSVGVDMVDLTACRDRGIWVTNVPAAATEEVASHALALTMALIRGLPWLDRDVHDGVWDGTRQVLRRPSELTVGVIGLGRIGRRYADYVRPIVRRVVGYDPMVSEGGDVELLELDDLLAVSDVVSLHLPLNDGSRGLLDDRCLSLLPYNAVVINVSRGGLVDHSALLAHLDSGHLAAAGLDVLPVEPPRSDDPVVAHPLVLVTPHAAYLSAASAHDYVLHQARNVAAWLKDGQPTTAVLTPGSVAQASATKAGEEPWPREPSSTGR